jgi:hypothetical protein
MTATTDVARTEEERLSDEEWLRRYDARITERSDFEGSSYSEMTGKEDTLSMFREIGDPFDNCPEDAADEEMSNWDDDGE